MLTRRHRRRTHRRDDGFSLVLMSLLLVTLLGIAALVVDLGGWQVEASNMQQAADAAALAGVVRLPDGDAAAIARARSVAADNGYTHDPANGTTVAVAVLGDETLEVTITEDDVGQFFAQAIRNGGTTSITRTSTSQYVQPVPLGSPRNYLGTNELLAGDGTGGTVTGDGVENFYLAVSGECTRREYGDRITAIATKIPGTHNCTPGTNGAIDNPEYDPRGYLFGVTVPEASGATPVAIQMFDAPTCTNTGDANVIFGEDFTPHETQVTVRRYDDLDPYNGTQLYQRTFQGRNSTDGHCRFDQFDDLGTDADNRDLECQANNRLRECWITLTTVSAPGDYTIQVDPILAADRTRNTRHDVFSLRAKSGGTFVPCTSDVSDVAGSPAYLATCAQVYGLEHLPIYARGNDDPEFFLASIDSRHGNKTMQVTFFDTAEGADGLRLIDPNGNPAMFDWDILCANGTEAPCDAPEQNPVGARTNRPGPQVSYMDVENPRTVGSGLRTYDTNVQNGKYSERLIRLTLKLPADLEAIYGDRTWWKVEYVGDFTGDRTTWSVKLLGDPVRLLPNATPTTAPTP